MECLTSCASFSWTISCSFTHNTVFSRSSSPSRFVTSNCRFAIVVLLKAIDSFRTDTTSFNAHHSLAPASIYPSREYYGYGRSHFAIHQVLDQRFDIWWYDQRYREPSFPSTRSAVLHLVVWSTVQGALVSRGWAWLCSDEIADNHVMVGDESVDGYPCDMRRRSRSND